MVYAVEDDQTIPADGMVSAYALCVGPHAIRSRGGRSTVEIGDPAASPRAGVILNCGSILATTLRFGDAEGLVYTSGHRNEIASGIEGRRGIIFFGPGCVRLTGSNNYRGGTVVDSGTVIVARTAGTGLGTGDVKVCSGGTLVVEGVVDGKVVLERDSYLILDGGTIGGIAIQYGGHMATGGILEGGGTIRGASDVRGTICARKAMGVLTFAGPVKFATTSFYWSLTALDDTPGGEGKYWNSLEFNLPTSFGTPDDPIWILLEFPNIPNPDSGHPFWSHPRRWLLARFDDSQDLYYNQGNFVFTRGSFGILQTRHEAFLVYEPWAP
jgi:autotransporter-associated beta strand protein